MYLNSVRNRACGCYIADGCCSGVAVKRGSTVVQNLIHVHAAHTCKRDIINTCMYLPSCDYYLPRAYNERERV